MGGAASCIAKINALRTPQDAQDRYAALRTEPTMPVLHSFATDLSRFGGHRYDAAKAVKLGGYSLQRSVELAYLADIVYFTDPYWCSKKATEGKARAAAELSLPVSWELGVAAPDAAGSRGLYGYTLADSRYDTSFDDGEGVVSHGIVTHAGSDTEAMVVTRAETNDLALVFRGTSTWKDVATDLGFFRTGWDILSPEAGVHRSFLAAWQSLSAAVLRILDAEWETGHHERLWLTGHSLGGAVCTLAAMEIAKRRPGMAKALRVYTFGSPLVGNKEFCDEFDAAVPCTWRHVNDRDIVACVPPPAFGFDHVGHLVTLNSMGLWIDARKAVLEVPDDGYKLGEEAADHKQDGYEFMLQLCRATIDLGHEGCSKLSAAWRAYVDSHRLIEVVLSVDPLADNGGSVVSAVSAQRIRVPDKDALVASLKESFGLSARFVDLILREAIRVSRWAPRSAVVQLAAHAEPSSVDAVLNKEPPTGPQITLGVLQVAFWNCLCQNDHARRLTLSRALAMQHFEVYDTDGDGFLQPAEFAAFWLGEVDETADVLEVGKMFERLDVNTDGEVSFEEIATAMHLAPELLKESSRFPTPETLWDHIDESEGSALRHAAATEGANGLSGSGGAAVDRG